MTVYVLFFINFHSEDEFLGVYSSQENAQAYIDRSGDPASSFRIDPHELD